MIVEHDLGEFNKTPPVIPESSPIDLPQLEASSRSWYKFYQDSAQKYVDNPGFVTYRGLTRENTPRTEQSYLEVLPTFKNQNLIDLIKQKIAEKPGQKIVVADVGYGMGRAFLELHQLFGDNVELVAIGETAYAKKGSTITNSREVAQPTYDQLSAIGVRFVEGNALDIEQLVGSQAIDILFSVHALEYTLYPNWELIKKIYRCLKPGGYALLHSISIFAENGDVAGYLQANGYEFELNQTDSTNTTTTAFHKTHPEIDVPIENASDEVMGQVKILT